MSWYSDQPFSVYVISAGDHQKIGSTAAIQTRLRVMQGAHYATLSLVLSVPCRDLQHARQVEQYAFWLLRDLHARGEWFRVSVDDACAAVRSAVAAVERGGRAKFATRHTAGPLRRPLKRRDRLLVAPTG